MHHCPRLVLGFSVLALSACNNCLNEDLNKAVCSFTVAPHDARPDSPAGVLTGPLLYGEVQKGSERARTITINNAGSNVPLTQLNLSFSEVNRESFTLRGDPPELSAGASAQVTVVFSPIPIEGEIGNTLTVSHPPIDEVPCPTWTVTLRGRALPPDEPDGGVTDAGPPDAGRDAGVDAGVDAGPVFPRPDAGLPMGDAGHFEARGGLQSARTEFGAVTLATGEVLVVGGFDFAGQVLATTEYLDPATGLSRMGPPLNVARARHSVSRLPDGTVLVFGGVDNGAVDVAQVLGSLEVLAPGGTAWTRQDTTQKRADHLAVPNGNLGIHVLYGVTAGPAGQPPPLAPAPSTVARDGTITVLASDSGAAAARLGAALVDMGDGTWVIAGGVYADGNYVKKLARLSAGSLAELTVELATGRAFAAAARFADGPLVVAGGLGSEGPLTSAEQVDVTQPDPLSWTVEPVLSPVMPRIMGAAIQASPDVVLLSGGVSSWPGADENVEARADAEILVHVTSVGVLAAGALNEPSIPRVAGAVVSYDGGVALLGGSATLPRRQARPDLERFLPAANRFESMGLIGPGGAATGAAPRQMLVVGGTDLSTGRASARTRLLDLQTGFFHEGGPIQVARTDATATLLTVDGSILVAGGTSANGDALGHAERMVGDFSASETVGAMLAPRRRHTATALLDGRVLLCGGLGTGAVALNTCELFDPAQDTFSAVNGRMVRGRYDHSATLLDSGKVLLTGGNDPALGPFAGDVFDPVADRLHATAGFPVVARRGHMALLVGQGKVLLAGGETYVGERVPTDTAEIWSEGTETYDSLMPLSTARDGPAGLGFANGIALITGGGLASPDTPDFPTRALSRTEQYDPADGALGGFHNVDVPLRFPRARATGVDILGQPTVFAGEGRHGTVVTGAEVRIPLTTVELWVQ
ncbi:MAG: hypothetical protein HY904_15900 [Deltaproteobacteria bacterium]|nr:hypothetical protein [Deltaproteobacteria bacterium]